jgi:hypothetical protein
MRSATCASCGKTWSVLPDGTLVEHPQPAIRALLCPGSRTRVVRDPGRAAEAAPVKRAAGTRRLALAETAAAGRN